MAKELDNVKEVYFNEFCPTCANMFEPNSDPELTLNDKCHDCLNTPGRQYSHKPLNYEQK